MDAWRDASREPSSQGGQLASGRERPFAPELTLPKGGGAVRGLGEKFAVQLARGTGTLTIPIRTSPARASLFEVALSYDSGAGNGPFGLGWSLSLPSVSRRTDKGIPRYREPGDVFLFMGEELVPALRNASTDPLSIDVGGFRVRPFRPRVETSFSRIEQWTDRQNGDVHWRTVSKDNVVSIYGRSAETRVADPADAGRIFQWLLEETRDDLGNVAAFVYKREDTEGVAAVPYERNRVAAATLPPQRYLKRIRYGNRNPTPDASSEADWTLEIVLDYGEHGPFPTPGEDGPWRSRADPFSSCRPGFELRTYRLCRRILQFHRFGELGPEASLVRSVELGYDERPSVSRLSSVTEIGHARENGVWMALRLPTVQLRYTEHAPSSQLQSLATEAVENVPAGVDERRYQWVDLEAEGLPGILTEQAEGWFYRRNLGAGRLGPTQLLVDRPNLDNVAGGLRQLVDLTGEGRPFLVQLTGATAGYQERTSDGHWKRFVPFPSVANLSSRDASVRLIDLDGDGTADLLVTEDEVLCWYPIRGREGFGAPEQVARPADEEQGPALVFSNSMEGIYLADMTGDGLLDLVRVRNAEICYWQNLGHGRFGPKVAMTGAPLFDAPDQFQQRRIRLADVDGTGTTDLLYLGRDRVRCWLNQSGNRFAEPFDVAEAAGIEDAASVAVTDLLGTGTACLVWSSPLPRDASTPVRYVELTGGIKPHLLASVENGLGMRISLQYAPSTRFYVADRALGRPWATRLPFVLQLVSKVTTEDLITGDRLVTTYSYHHGHYDGVEREFCGFGMVEQRDLDDLPSLTGVGSEAKNVTIPAVVWKRWFHTGAFLGGDSLRDALAVDFYDGDPVARPLPDSSLPPALDARSTRHALRALRGRPIREELFAEDGVAAPYSVIEHAHEVRMLQPPRGPTPGVFAAFRVETRTHQYERVPDDPRVSHELTLVVDDYGEVTRSAAVAYPRQPRPTAEPEQQQLHVLLRENDYFTHDMESDRGWYRAGLPLRARTYEVVVPPAKAGPYYRREELLPLLTATERAYDEPAAGGLEKRLLSAEARRYWRDDLAGPLPWEEAERRALAYETYRLALTDQMATRIHANVLDPGDPSPPSLAALLSEGGYVTVPGLAGWWIPSGRTTFDAARFYRAIRFEDPFHNSADVAYDAYGLLVRDVADAVQNAVHADNDYRVLRPWRVTDANGNVTQARFDEQGNVLALAASGKPTAGGGYEGDALGAPTKTYEYHVREFVDHGRPPFVYAGERELHGAVSTAVRESWLYSDGVGRELQRKVRAEPSAATPGTDRFVGSGRTIFDGKGRPTRQYEPFFSDTPAYESEQDLVQRGVTPVIHYDPAGRVVRVDRPDGTYSKVELTAWERRAWDENDTVADSRWYSARPDPSTPDGKAAKLTFDEHRGTYTSTAFDSLGRAFLSVADNGSRGKYATRHVLDIGGRPVSTIDALGRTALSADFDLVGRSYRTASIDGGEQWQLTDVAGKTVRARSARGYAVRAVYDANRRPRETHVRRGAVETLAEAQLWGEGVPGDRAANLRGRLYRQRDGAGQVTFGRYDFDGRLVDAYREVATDYKTAPDWSGPVALDPPVRTHVEQDALGRATAVRTDDGTLIRPTYNRAGFLETVRVKPRWGPELDYVTDVDYDAKGQRTRIGYGNGASTTHEYDPLTFRLIGTRTITAAGQRLQDLAYTYDPVGNITRLEDAAQQTVFFANAMAAPVREFEYDALYRLAHATGREHIGQTADPYQTRAPGAVPLPQDWTKLRAWAESYEIDPIGNLTRVAHVAASGSWTRGHRYAPSSNQLLATSAPGDPPGQFSVQPYAHDEHGNLTALPHMQRLTWDWREQLASCDAVGGGRVYFTYDASGERVRQVHEDASGRAVRDRIYTGPYEIYREFAPDGAIDLERQTVHVLDGRRRLAMIETLVREGGVERAQKEPRVRYQLADHLGSSLIELDDAGGVISYEEYGPFGTTALYAANAHLVPSAKRYRYTARERDEQTGLAYHGARYYAPWLGRWIAPDPQIPNRADDALARPYDPYGYVRGNPMSRVDPDGRDDKPPALESDLRKLQSLKIPALGFLVPTPYHREQGGDIQSPLLRSQAGIQQQAAQGGGTLGFQTTAAAFAVADVFYAAILAAFALAPVAEAAAPAVAAGVRQGVTRAASSAGTLYRALTVQLGLLYTHRPWVVVLADLLVGLFAPPGTPSLSPASIGLKTVAEDAKLVGIFEQALRDAGKVGNENAYTRLLELLDRGGIPSGKELQSAWNEVSKRFLPAARAAGYDIATVHHWNFPKSVFWRQVFDPRNLVPLTSSQVAAGLHEALHQATVTLGSHLYSGRIDPVYELLIEGYFHKRAGN